MARPGCDLESLPRHELKPHTVNLKHRLPLQDEKELACHRVKMSTFPITGRHTLLDHAEISAIEQVPPLTRLPPPIVLARSDVHNLKHAATLLTVLAPPAGRPE